MFFSKGAVILATLSLVAGNPHKLSELHPRQQTTLNLTFTDYLYVYFTGELLANGEQVYMAVSNNNDPRSWTTLNGGDPILTSNVGMKGIRDPSLIMAPDRSKYYLISTDLKVNGIGWNNGYCYTCNGSRSFVIWESTDLINWSGPSHREVAPSNAGMAWAPDAIWHPGKQQYMVFWTSKLDGKQELHNLRSFTPDFKTFSPAETWVDLGMDNTIALDRAANKYYMISKNGPKDGIQQNVADSVDGPWKLVAEEIGLDKLPAGEGPLIFQNNINPAKWHLWIDDYKNAGGGRYVPFETEDLAAGRWKASEGYKLPSNPRHGYVVSITAAERETLMQLQK